MSHKQSISEARLYEGLKSALGAEIGALLLERDVTDVMCNADGRVFVDRAGVGRQDSGIKITAAAADYALRMLASWVGAVLTKDSPRLSATLPVTGERIAGTIAPVTERPTFAIRKPPADVFPLGAFCVAGQELAISLAASALVEERRNILIAGGTGSGKTSLLSCLLQADSVRNDRLLILEDTREIVSSAPDQVRMLACGDVSMRDLVQQTLRYRPDRIIIGEVRDGKAALEMVRALNTGAAGSFGTIHSNSAADTLGRLEDLCAEEVLNAPRSAIGVAIGAIIYMARRPADGRKIREIIRVEGTCSGVYNTIRLWPATSERTI